MSFLHLQGPSDVLCIPSDQSVRCGSPPLCRAARVRRTSDTGYINDSRPHAPSPPLRGAGEELMAPALIGTERVRRPARLTSAQLDMATQRGGSDLPPHVTFGALIVGHPQSERLGHLS